MIRRHPYRTAALALAAGCLGFVVWLLCEPDDWDVDE